MCSVKTYRVIIDYPYVLGRVDRLNKIHIFMPIKKTQHTGKMQFLVVSGMTIHLDS